MLPIRKENTGWEKKTERSQRTRASFLSRPWHECQSAGPSLARRPGLQHGTEKPGMRAARIRLCWRGKEEEEEEELLSSCVTLSNRSSLASFALQYQGVLLPLLSVRKRKRS